MRAVLQRVSGATVHVHGKLISRIGPGIVALIGIGTDDTADEIAPLTAKILGTKLWNEGLKASDIHVPPQYTVEGSASAAAAAAAAAQASSTTKAADDDDKHQRAGKDDVSTVDNDDAKSQAEKVWGGKPWKTNVVDLDGEVLCISQFTLHARLNKGTKPDFHRSMGGEEAKRLYEQLLQRIRTTYRADRVKDGAFGAMMDCSLTNDGPVTILVDTLDTKKEKV